jgi:hypothetical protein
MTDAIDKSTDFIEIASDVTGIETSNLFRGFKKVVDVGSTIVKVSDRYNECRESNKKPTKAYCAMASTVSTGVEHLADNAGKTMVVEGTVMAGTGLTASSTGVGSIPGGLVVATGVSVTGVGMCTIAKAEEIGDEVFKFIMDKHKGCPNEIVVVSGNDEYLKLNIKEKSITPINKNDASIIVNQHIDHEYQQRLMTLQTLSSEVADIRKDIDTISKTHTIDQQKPIESLKQVEKNVELCYDNINDIFQANINYNNNIKDNANKPTVLSERHKEYVDLVEKIKTSPYEKVQVKGGGSSGGGFFIIIPVLAIPFSGGCTLL